MAYLSSSQATDFSTVKSLAEQALHHSVFDIKPLAGYIAHNFLVNQEIIFKIASARSNADEWQRVVVNAPVLQSHLSVQIPIPTLHKLDLDKQQIFALSYRQLPGYVLTRESFSDRSSTFKYRYFDQLSEKIHELHSIPPHILPICPPNVLEQATGMLSENQSLKNILLEVSQYLFPYKAKQDVLLHADLHPQNVCIEDAKITGILDFDSLSVGHSVFEFRPDLYVKQQDAKYMMENYVTKNPSEFSFKTGKDFYRKYNTLIFLFTAISLLKPKRFKKTRLDGLLQTIQAQQTRAFSFKANQL